MGLGSGWLSRGGPSSLGAAEEEGVAGEAVGGGVAAGSAPARSLSGRSCHVSRDLAATCVEQRCGCKLQDGEAEASPVRCRLEAGARCVMDHCCGAAEGADSEAEEAGQQELRGRVPAQEEVAAAGQAEEGLEAQSDSARWRALAAELRSLSGSERSLRAAALTKEEEAGLRRWLLEQRRPGGQAR